MLQNMTVDPDQDVLVAQQAQADFDRFMEEYGDFFPDHPGDLEQLVDSLARRIAAAQRLLDSLSDEQRSELAGLMSQTEQPLDAKAIHPPRGTRNAARDEIQKRADPNTEVAPGLGQVRVEP